ncbi:MAG TPA: hypothetical protein VMF13_18760, partial [Luteitalea sp.]|nr:hypothetical protein [Luteitalea sp.]
MTYRAIAGILAGLVVSGVAASEARAQQPSALSVRVSWGHKAGATQPRVVSVEGREGLTIKTVTGRGLERGEAVDRRITRSTAGSGDVDGIDLVVEAPAPTA